VKQNGSFMELKNNQLEQFRSPFVRHSSARLRKEERTSTGAYSAEQSDSVRSSCRSHPSCISCDGRQLHCAAAAGPLFPRLTFLTISSHSILACCTFFRGAELVALPHSSAEMCFGEECSLKNGSRRLTIFLGFFNSLLAIALLILGGVYTNALQ
jgi:hypothetical protein